MSLSKIFKLGLFLAFLLLGKISIAQVTVTSATASGNACIGGSAVSLSNIIISEGSTGGAEADIGNGSTGVGTVTFDISLSNSTDFRFVSSVGSVSAIPGTQDITSISLSYQSSTTLRINLAFDNSGGDTQDFIVISGLQVYAISGSPTATSLTLSALSGTNAGSPAINGFTVNTTTFGSVTSVAMPTLSSPLSPTPICSGSIFNYTPSSATGGATFSWTRAAVSGISQTGTSGSNGVSEVLTNTSNVPIDVTYVYTTSANGCSNSQNVVVTVIPTPSVTDPSDVVVCNGSNTSAISFSGTATSYSWTNSNTTIGLGTNGTGTIASFLATNAGTSPISGTITVTPVYTFNAVSCNGPVQTFTMTVNPTPLLTSTLVPAAICSGGTFNYTATSSTGGASFSWTRALVAGISEGASSGLGNVSEVLTNTTVNPVNVTYQYTVSANGCTNASVYSVVVTVNPSPVLSSGLNAAVCSDVIAGINLATSGVSVGALNYTINSISVASGLTPASGNATAGSGKANSAIANDKFTNPTNTPLTVTYNVSPVSSDGCLGNAVDVVLTVNPEPVLSTTLNSTVCSDVVSGITLNTNGSSVGATGYILISVIPSIAYSSTWIKGAGAALGSITPTGILNDTYTNLTGGALTVTYNITPVNGSCLGDAYNVVLTINPEPVGVAKTATVCSDAAINYNLINNVAIFGNNVGATFTWSAIDNTNVSGESTSLQVGGIITDIITNLTNTPQAITYNITPTSVQGCVGEIFQVIVTVDPEPVGTTSTTVICSNSQVGYALQANVNLNNNLPATFNWVATSNANVSGESTLTRIGSSIDDLLVNNTNSPEVVVYTITPFAQSTGCMGNVFTISVTVNPRAKISAGADIAICSDIPTIGLQGTINYAPNGVLWSGGTGVFSNSALATSNYTYNNPSEINTTFTLNLKAMDPDGAGPCPEENDQMLLTVNPLPVVAIFNLPPEPSPGVPPQVAENSPIRPIQGSSNGGLFTIAPGIGVGSTYINSNGFDETLFDPDAATIYSGNPSTINQITYTYTNLNGCTNSITKSIIVNAITNVDFAIQGATVNATTGNYQICADINLVKLLGFPDPIQGYPPETEFTSLTLGLTIVKSGTDYFIQTNGVASGTYEIKYTFKNFVDAISFRIRSVDIFASPVAQIASANNCIASDVVFTDQSTINPTPFPTSITAWQWSFGDNKVDLVQNPSHRYDVSAQYSVSLIVTTQQGCSDVSSPYSVRVGDVPLPDFNWSAICNDEFTKFQDGSDPGNISVITNYTWNFGDGTVVSGAQDSVWHKYASFGTYDATITVLTNDGCDNSLTKKVFILPYATAVVTASGKFEDFEATDGGWIAEAFEKNGSLITNISDPGYVGSDTSWIWGPPAGLTITSAAAGSGKAWWTGHNQTILKKSPYDTYYKTENSVVNGPCFDLTLLKRPMISLDYFSDLEKNVDGVVLQYSIDGGLNWEVVGNNTDGISWHNGSAIQANPGGQTIGNFGWTDKQGDWENARFNLDMIPGSRTQVRLRLALATNDGNASGATYDGFAFDNVFVGEKPRNVLVEHFTNADPAVKSTNAYLDNLLTNEIIYRKGAPDFRTIQYHLGSPVSDVLFEDNPDQQDARSIYYGNTKTPFTVMDGRLGTYDRLYVGANAPEEITPVTIDRRSLTEPEFDIILDTLATTADSIIVRVDLTANVTYPDPVIVQATLIDDGFSAFRNVFRKGLFGREGETVVTPWALNDQKTFTVRNSIDLPISRPDSLAVIAYVFDRKTRVVLQSAYLKINGNKRETVVTGLEGESSSSIKLYPNPSTGISYLSVEGQQNKSGLWHVVDQRGVIVLKGEWNNSNSPETAINVSGLANGLYFVKVSQTGKPSIFKKLIVNNQH